MYDWLSIAMSGYVECHGFDQAALGVLIASKILGKLVPAPLGFTCRYNQTNANAGCNGRAAWSCDFLYEQALTNAGFKTDNSGFFKSLSSFTKVCNLRRRILKLFYVLMF